LRHSHQPATHSLKLLLTIGLLFIILSASSQIKVDVKATGKHAKAINDAKEVGQTAKEKKEEAERIKEQVEAARERYKKQYDSLKIIHMDTLQFDSLNTPEFTEEDSLALANEILSNPVFTEFKKILDESILSEPDLENADSIAFAKAKAVLEEHAKSYLPAELNQAGDPLKELPFNPLAGGVPDLEDGIPEIQKPTRPNPNLIKPDQARELFKKIDPKQFEEVQENLKGLKAKYSELPDTRFPEEGVKRNSLKDVPFKKRLYVGGNFSIQSTDPFIIDTNPQVGYWINKKWLSGAGIIVREQFGKRDSLQLLTGDAHGFNVFTRFDIKSGIFGRAEVESQISKSLFNKEEETESIWQNAYLLGLGREFKIGPVRMTSMILYDFNYKNNNLNARPLVLKMGFEISKKPE
jgi:hypothetical protein